MSEQNTLSGVASDYRELLLGCGYSRRKKYAARITDPLTWRNPKGPVTLDINMDCVPDLWCDLNQSPPWHARPRQPLYRDSDSIALNREMGIESQFRNLGPGLYEPVFELESDYWDEIHAYQVLEHLGRQGDAASFFAQFSEIWRLLRSGGVFVGEVPSRFSEGLWGDPSHARAIVPMHLSFLDQSEYIRQCDGRHPTGMSDFRRIYQADFKVIFQSDNRSDFAFILEAVKPSRWVRPKHAHTPATSFKAHDL